MSTFSQLALTFVQELISACSQHYVPEHFALLCDKRVSWINTELDAPCKGQRQVQHALQLGCFDSRSLPDALQLEAAPLSDKLCIVYGVIRAPRQRPNQRVTFVVERTGQELRLVHLHSSYSKGSVLSQRFQSLTRDIPGGIHHCRNDSYFTMIAMSEGFLNMFGYTRKEIRLLFNDRFIYMLHPDDRVPTMQAAAEQLQHGPDFELEYRIIPKHGPPVWILDRGRLLTDSAGSSYFACLLIEINDRKHAQEELRLSLERHQVIVDQTTDIIFQWDILADTLSFSPNWFKKFGYEPIHNEITKLLPASGNLHAEDIPALLELMRKTSTGTPYCEAEFRIRDSAGHYFWNRIRATAQFDDEHNPLNVVGVIIDIDSEKRQKEALLEQAQRDALTGLYNKAAINALVTQHMAREPKRVLQALMIIDIDHFKAVNDTYGHLCGDNLLSDVSSVLKGRTRSTDLVGRIGGDEFLVYFPQISDADAAAAKAASLWSSLHLLTPAEGAAPITCSIGVAVFPRGSIDYFALYKCADEALYYRKDNGRGGVTFYSEGICGGHVPFGLSPTAVGDAIISDEGAVMDEQLAQYAFRVLYRSTNIAETLHRLLEIIGQSYGVGRVYIFEYSADSLTCYNTFEWCSDGIPSMLKSMASLPLTGDFSNYSRHFSTQGIFFCPDMEASPPDLDPESIPEGVCSFVQCATLDDGVFRGFVGFDEYRREVSWGAEQIASFRLIANVLSTFVLKLRMKQELERGQH